jgi:hypothetical protein
MNRLTKTAGWSLALLFPLFLSSLAKADAMYGLFMIVKGDVSFQNPNGALEKAKVGAKVFEGATVKSEKDSRAKIVMADRNVFNLSPESKMTIQKYDATAGKKNVSLSLEEGKVRVNVEQKYDGNKEKFLLKTPTVVAGVRGTQFLAGYNSASKTSQVVTFKGSVAMTSFSPSGQPMGTVRVEKGQSSTAGAGQAPATPRDVPAQELKDLDKSSASTGDKKSGSGSGSVKVAGGKDTDADGAKEIKVSSNDSGNKGPAILAPPSKPPGPPPPPPPPPPQVTQVQNSFSNILIRVH